MNTATKMSDRPASQGMLIYIPWPSNMGYAIHRAESQFFEMAMRLTGSVKKVHFAFTSLRKGHPKSLPPDFGNVHQFSIQPDAPVNVEGLAELIERESIDLMFGYDLRVEGPFYDRLRSAGLKSIVSYLGAPMSSVNSFVKSGQMKNWGYIMKNRRRKKTTTIFNGYISKS